MGPTEFGVGLEVHRLAVDRHQHLGLDQVVEALELLAAGVAGDMHQAVVAGDDLDAAVDEHVLDVDDFALIAGNGPGGEDHLVAGVEVDHRVLAAGDAGDRGPGFALAARAEQHHLVARQGLEHFLVEEWREAFHHAQLAGDARDPVHGAARHHDLPAGLLRGAGDGNHPADIRGEGGDGNAVGGGGDQALERRSDFGFARADAFLERIGRIADQGQRPLHVADFGQPNDVGRRVADGGRIELPVAGVEDAADRGGDQERIALGNRVGDVDRLDSERPERKRPAGPHQRYRDVLDDIVGGAFGREHGCRERGGEDRPVEAGPQVKDGAVMVLVAVGEDQAEDVVGVLLEKGGIGHDQLDTGLVRAAKGDPAIDHDPLAIVEAAEAIGSHVHADLADAPKGDEDEFISGAACHKLIPIDRGRHSDGRRR